MVLELVTLGSYREIQLTLQQMNPTSTTGELGVTAGSDHKHQFMVYPCQCCA